MALDFLKSNVAKLEINLDRQAYQPGDQISGRITLQVEDEVKVSRGRIFILCLVKYQVRTHHTGSHGGYNTFKWVTETREVFSKTILEEMVIPPRFYQTYDFEWQVASDALPSLEGKIIKVTWLVKVHLDRPKAIDITVERLFRVNRPMPVEDHYPFTNSEVRSSDAHLIDVGQAFILPGQNKVFGKQEDVELSLVIPRLNWELGEDIEGALEIQAGKDCKFTEIRMELNQSEEVYDASGNKNVTSEKAKLAGSTTMKTGEKLSIPFHVTIPSGKLPSLDAGNRKVNWILDAILARRLAADYHISHSLKVYTKT